MADEIDRANDRAQQILNDAIQAARGVIQPGVAGECSRCGEMSGRLILDCCARCRDRYRLP